MTITLSELLNALNNYFDAEDTVGEFTISGSVFSNLPSNIQTNQWYRIQGSVFNDGIHQNPATNLTDEVFTGTVSSMAIPVAVTELLNRINEWEASNSSQDNTGITSESFGGYSYSKAVGSDGMPATWKDIFAKDIRRWKKL